MGVSTDAILLYGICVASETVEQFEEHEDEAETYKRKGANPLGYMAWSGGHQEHGGVTLVLVSHQSASYPEYIVAVAETVVTAWRGNPKQIKSLASKPEWDDALAKFCEANKVTTDGATGWWLASDWGQ